MNKELELIVIVAAAVLVAVVIAHAYVASRAKPAANPFLGDVAAIAGAVGAFL